MTQETPTTELIDTTDLTRLDDSNLEKFVAEDPEKGTYVSLLVPMEKSGSETRKNHIIFKNVLSEARSALSNNPEANAALLKQISRLDSLDDSTHEYWQHQSDGLAVFLSTEHEPRGYRLPFAPNESSVHIGKSPSLGALLPMMNQPRYYVLVLDLNETRLFEASRHTFRQLPLDNVPTSLDEAMRFDDPEKSLQFRTVSSPGAREGGRVDAAYHGHGVTSDATEQIKIDRFFEKLSGGLADNFPDRETPLLLFGPASEVGHFRPTNHYPQLLENSIDFNPSNLSDEELKGKIQDWIESDSQRISESESDQLGNALGMDRGSSDPAEVVKASITGKVDTLFLHQGETVYGQLDRETLSIKVNENAKPGDADLSEVAAIETLRNGGKIRYVSGESSSVDETGMGAIFRY